MKTLDKDSQVEVSKRSFLRGLTVLMGATAVSQLVCSQSLAAAFDYHQAGTAQYKRKLFTQAQMTLLQDICAAVIPKTDTPSAAELGVHGFIDHQLVTCHSKAQQARALALLTKIEQQSIKHYHDSFVELSAEQQANILRQLEAKGLDFDSQDRQDFKGLKSLLVFGYFTSEVGATEVLNYQAVPGGFKGSVPYSELKKSWGSLGFY